MSKRMMVGIAGGVVLALAGAGCAEGEPGEPGAVAVSEAALDETLEEGKYDSTTSYLVKWMGSMDPNDSVSGSTTWSKRYQGYTLALTAGQTVKFSVTSSKLATVKVYGPATSTGSTPKFKSALVTKTTTKSGSSYVTSFEVKIATTGTYGIVYWPKYTSSSSYSITSSCVAGCETECGDKDMFASCDDGNGFCGCADWECPELECKPYAQEGDSCGGFTPVHMFQVCDPSLECVAPSFIMDIPGTCSASVTVAQLIDNAMTYDGHWVSLEGKVTQGGSWCTLMMCPSWNPCCNTCGSGLRFSDGSTEDSLSLTENGETWGCYGTSCDSATECTGEEGSYFISGVYDADLQTIAIEKSYSIPSFGF